MMKCKEQYTNDDGLIISASQARILKRRKRIVELYKEMLPKYASYRQLYLDIADIISNETLVPCADYTVLHDLQQMGVVKNTQQSRIRKERQ